MSSTWSERTLMKFAARAGKAVSPFTRQASAQPGLTFFTAYDGQLFHPFLVDMDGNVVHRWETRYSDSF